MRKSLALLALCLLIVAPAAMAQEEAMQEEAMQQEPMFVSVTFVKVKSGMEADFMAAAAAHRDWHAETGDTHYYGASEAVTGHATGHIAFSAGPMTAAQLNEYDDFRKEDLGDFAARGGMEAVAGVHTVVMQTMPHLGNPPPPGYMADLVHVWKIQVDPGKLGQFNQGLQKMDAIQSQVGDEGYVAWTEAVSGADLGTYYFVEWTDGWSGPDMERQMAVMEAAGGEEAYGKLMQHLGDALHGASITSYRPLPDLSYYPSE